MLNKNLFKKFTLAVLAMCFLACLNFGCLAKYPDVGENSTENEFGISSNEIEVDPEGDGTNGSCLRKDELSVITPNVAKKVLNEDQIQKEGNHDESAQTVRTDICSDEDVPSFSDYKDGFESDEDENNQNELNDKESTKNYFKAKTPKISEFVLNIPIEDVSPRGSEDENE